ncbi:MAG: cupin domain-containing protein [Pseudomonadota bacterium]
MAGEIDVGSRIRVQRKAAKLTLKQLAEKVGCTDAHLSQVENGRVSPSISSLKRIAEALQTKITDFFVESENDEPVVMSPDQRVLITLDRWNAKIHSLVRNPGNKRMHPFYTVIQPGGGSHGLYSHLGEECGIVLKGELEIELNGKVYKVRENDSFYYNSSEPHSWMNRTKKETVVVWVISPPTF